MSDLPTSTVSASSGTTGPGTAPNHDLDQWFPRFDRSDADERRVLYASLLIGAVVFSTFLGIGPLGRWLGGIDAPGFIPTAPATGQGAPSRKHDAPADRMSAVAGTVLANESVVPTPAPTPPPPASPSSAPSASAAAQIPTVDDAPIATEAVTADVTAAPPTETMPASVPAPVAEPTIETPTDTVLGDLDFEQPVPVSVS